MEKLSLHLSKPAWTVWNCVAVKKKVMFNQMTHHIAAEINDNDKSMFHFWFSTAICFELLIFSFSYKIITKFM